MSVSECSEIKVDNIFLVEINYEPGPVYSVFFLPGQTKAGDCLLSVKYTGLLFVCKRCQIRERSRPLEMKQTQRQIKTALLQNGGG